MESPPRDFKSLASTIPPLGRKRKDTTKPGLSQMFIGGCSKTVEIVEGKVGVFFAYDCLGETVFSDKT